MDITNVFHGVWAVVAFLIWNYFKDLQKKVKLMEGTIQNHSEKHAALAVLTDNITSNVEELKSAIRENTAETKKLGEGIMNLGRDLAVLVAKLNQ